MHAEKRSAGRLRNSGAKNSLAASSVATHLGRALGIVAYLSDHFAIGGPETLFQQKAAIEAYVAETGSPLTFAIDSGAPANGCPYGHAVLVLLRKARRGNLSVLVVAHVAYLAKDYASALLIAVQFAELGVRVIEAGSGSFRCDPQILALVKEHLTNAAGTPSLSEPVTEMEPV